MKTYEAIVDLLSKIDSIEETRLISAAVVERRTILEKRTAGALSVGQPVTFVARGRRVVGIVEKVNRTRVRVRALGGGGWNCTPSLLTPISKAECDKLFGSSVMTEIPIAASPYDSKVDAIIWKDEDGFGPVWIRRAGEKTNYEDSTQVGFDGKPSAKWFSRSEAREIALKMNLPLAEV